MQVGFRLLTSIFIHADAAGSPSNQQKIPIGMGVRPRLPLQHELRDAYEHADLGKGFEAYRI